jgi:hypothetical protein
MTHRGQRRLLTSGLRIDASAFNAKSIGCLLDAYARKKRDGEKATPSCDVFHRLFNGKTDLKVLVRLEG